MCLNILWENSIGSEGFSKEISIQKCSSFNFQVKWVEGNPKIIKNLNPDIIGFTRESAYGDATFFNIKTRESLSEILDDRENKLCFDSSIQPLLYKDEIIILFKNGLEKSEIRICDIKEDKLSLKICGTFSLPNIVSMNLFHDHLIFQSQRYPHSRVFQIFAVSVKDFVDSGSAGMISRNLIWADKVIFKIFNESILLLWNGENNFVCGRLNIIDQKLEYKFYKQPDNAKKFFHQASTLHSTKYSEIFLTKFEYKTKSISRISKGSLKISNKARGKDFANLAPFKDSLILCSGNRATSLKFETLQDREEGLQTFPLNIHHAENYKFIRLDDSFTRLDKLFLIGTLASQREALSLVCINLRKGCIETSHLLDFSMPPERLDDGVGCFYLSSASSSSILKIQY